MQVSFTSPPFGRLDDFNLMVCCCFRLVCEDYPELTLPLENTILVNVDYDDYKSMKTVCDKYNKAVENIEKLWKGTARPDQLRTRPSSGKTPNNYIEIGQGMRLAQLYVYVVIVLLV